MEVQEVKETKKKASTKTVESKAIPTGVQALIDIGIPVRFAVFVKPVRSCLGTPETAFFAQEPNMKSQKVAKMWFTPHGLVTEQKGTYKIIPLANVSDTIVT